MGAVLRQGCLILDRSATCAAITRRITQQGQSELSRTPLMGAVYQARNPDERTLCRSSLGLPVRRLQITLLVDRHAAPGPWPGASAGSR